MERVESESNLLLGFLMPRGGSGLCDMCSLDLWTPLYLWLSVSLQYWKVVLSKEMGNERNKLGAFLKNVLFVFIFFLTSWGDEKADDQMSGMFWDLCVPSARYENILQGCAV